MKRFLLLLVALVLALGIVYVATEDVEIPFLTELLSKESAPEVAPAATPTQSAQPQPKAAPKHSAPKPTPKAAPKQSAPKPTPKAAPAPAPKPVDTNHLTFKGVYITGTLRDYVNSMKNAGFRLVSSGDGVARMSGDFAGFKGCTLLVSTIDNHDLVCSIDVLFPEQEQWGELHGDYSTLKKMLTQKYGTPASCVEKFQGSYDRDDNLKMYGVEFDNCKYITTFNAPKGRITLRIDHDNYDCYVRLTYTDKVNSAAVLSTAMSDL
jgi:hypothetical protein